MKLSGGEVLFAAQLNLSRWTPCKSPRHNPRTCDATQVTGSNDL